MKTPKDLEWDLLYKGEHHLTVYLPRKKTRLRRKIDRALRDIKKSQVLAPFGVLDRFGVITGRKPLPDRCMWDESTGLYRVKAPKTGRVQTRIWCYEVSTSVWVVVNALKHKDTERITQSERNNAIKGKNYIEEELQEDDDDS